PWQVRAHGRRGGGSGERQPQRLPDVAEPRRHRHSDVRRVRRQPRSRNSGQRDGIGNRRRDRLPGHSPVHDARQSGRRRNFRGADVPRAYVQGHSQPGRFHGGGAVMSTVSGSVTVGGTAYPVSAPLTLPSAPAAAKCQLGIYDRADDWPSSWSGIQAFQNAGLPVKVGTYYMQWPQGSSASNWPTTFANLCKTNGVIPFLEMEPWYSTTTWPAFTDIAAGRYDQYLTAVANSAKAFGSTVYMTFAHEQNGSWYPWGTGGTEGVTAAQWVAGW